MQITTPSEEEIWREGVRTRMLVSARTGASALCIFEQWIAPGAGAPPHRHPVEEILTVVSGVARVSVDDESARVAAGQSVTVAAGRRHAFQNVGDGTLHLRAVLASAVFETSYDEAEPPVRRWLAGPDVPGT